MAAWLCMIRKKDEAWCASCGEGTPEDGEHVVFHCPAFEAERGRLGQITEWKGLDRPIWLQGEGETKRDRVRELFGAISRSRKPV